MIKYNDILKIISRKNEKIFEVFNEKVGIPLGLSNCNSTIKMDGQIIIIEKDNYQLELDFDTRCAFTEIISLLKELDNDLYIKIEYKYIDFFEKFKNPNYNFESKDEVEKLDLKNLTIVILTIFYLKFWCKNDVERRNFLEIINPEKKFQEDEDIEIESVSEIEEKEENLKIIKDNWWLRFLNKLRIFGKKQ